MLHARKDYAHIQDETGKIGKDEPVFLLRAKDELAPDTIRHWASLLLYAGGDRVAYKEAMRQADLMEDWQEKNENKLPDTIPAKVDK